MIQPKNVICWCGNKDFLPFSDEYVFCENCKTLVLKEWTGAELFSVQLDDQDFYGKQYWFEHQVDDLGFGNILKRSRTDLPNRVLHWLDTLLKYKLPPGSTLELGCAHGGFVSVLQWAGFHATGLEMSPWVVDFARQTFQVPMLLGELEKQDLPAASLDAIILIDVLEHLPDPSATMSRCLELLKPDGILLIQTPRYPEGRTYQEMLDAQDPFLLQFKPPEHIYLFSQSSVKELFQRLGANHLFFEQAFFSQYDMFLVVSRSPLSGHTQEEIDQSMLATPGGRMILALLDKDIECKTLYEKLKEAEKDRSARLDQIQQYDLWLKESESDRASRLEVITNQGQMIINQEQAMKNQEQVILNLNADLTHLKSSFFFKVGNRLGIWK
jgi:2-polyprenyl-3-methyl-5-hydroxy-6-metoxy-1,4-benzoquinol methylase